MKRALLVIDVQNEYFTGKMPVSYPPGSLDNILRAMDSARAHHVPVVVVRHEAKGDRGVFKAGTEEWNLHKDVAARPADLLVDKNLPSSFAGTELEKWLRENQIDTLTVSGYMTQMCCDSTARTAHSPLHTTRVAGRIRNERTTTGRGTRRGSRRR